MDAIKLLTTDHDKVKQLLEGLVATTQRATKKRVQLSEQIKREIEMHTLVEDEIFYPAFKQAGCTKEDDRMYFEALEEHHAVGDLVLPDLIATPPESGKFSGRAKVLKELVEHHIKEEEREMFKRARKVMDKAAREALGTRLEQRKRELRTAIA